MATILYRFLTFDIWMIVLLCWFHTLRRKCAADSHAGAMKEKNTGRMEKSFEATQQEEHHSFRQKRIEQHFLTATVRLQKILTANAPV